MARYGIDTGYDNEAGDLSYPSETAVAEPTLGQDFHEATNQIESIDNEIARLQKRKSELAKRIESGLNEVTRHFSNVMSQDRPEL